MAQKPASITSYRVVRRFIPFLLVGTIASAITLVGAPQAVPPAASDLDTLRKNLELNQKILQDWPNLARYRIENAKLAPPAAGENRVVFLGDSITDAWGHKDATFFPGKHCINRGINGQTTPQMLLRFRSDVISLKPKVVVILAGTNDIAGKTGPESLEDIEGNLASMVQLANANNIRVVLSSLLPVSDYFRPLTVSRPPFQIIQLNEWIKDYCRKACIYLDYFTPMLDENGMLKRELTSDGLHPNPAGYAVMEPLAERAIQRALGDQVKRND